MSSRPNLFIAIRIVNSQVKKNLRNVLVSALEEDYNVKNYIEPLDDAHISVLVIYVDGYNQGIIREKFVNVCEANREELEKSRVNIDFDGVDTFGASIMFAKPGAKGTNFLRKIRDILDSQFMLNEEKIKDHSFHTFNPHLTLIKYDLIFISVPDAYFKT